jgi:hypothetical protein
MQMTSTKYWEKYAYVIVVLLGWVGWLTVSWCWIHWIFGFVGRWRICRFVGRVLRFVWSDRILGCWFIRWLARDHDHQSGKNENLENIQINTYSYIWWTSRRMLCILSCCFSCCTAAERITDAVPVDLVSFYTKFVRSDSAFCLSSFSRRDLRQFSRSSVQILSLTSQRLL